MKTVKSSKQRQHRPLMLRDVLTAIKAEIEAAGKALGFDVREEDWFELLEEELRTYSLPIGADDDEDNRVLALMPKHIRGRIRALQEIEFLTTDVLPTLEHENIPKEIDEAVERLRAAMALTPTATPLPELQEVA